MINGEPISKETIDAIVLLICFLLFVASGIYILFFRKDELVEAYLEECRKEREKNE